MPKKAILTLIGGGPGYTLEDKDLEGLECIIEHSIEDGYIHQSREWAEKMLSKIKTLRHEIKYGH